MINSGMADAHNSHSTTKTEDNEEKKLDRSDTWKELLKALFSGVEIRAPKAQL